MRRVMSLTLVLVWLGAACASRSGPGSSGSSASYAPAQPVRTLVVAASAEPKTLAARIIAQSAFSLHYRRIFNADLALLDDQSNPSAYLAETLPRLNTDDWKVFPDGRMETTYRLKPNLVWHDGALLTADDFVFSWQVYATPELGQAGSLPIKLIASVEAPDDRTLLIRWSQPYAAAGALQSLGFSAPIGLPPLPRSILGPALESGAQALLNHSHWATEYVGLGPYRLDRWEPGAFIEASAFDRHALGAPRIQRIKMLFLTDPNTALASMLSGEVQFANLPVAQASTLLRQWPPGAGSMVPYTNAWWAAHFQGRADMVSPAALQDRRVRQALAHTVDRAGINEAIYEGQNIIADSLFPSAGGLGQAANAAVTTYPFDLARSARLMAEAGFTKPSGAEFYVGPSRERFSPELRGTTGEFEPLTTAMAGGWRQAGFDIQQTALPASQVADLQAKSSYPGVAIQSGSGGEGAIGTMSSDNIPRLENQWRGAGLGFNGYSNPELDRLSGAFGAALEPADQNRAAADIVKLYSTELPAISLFFPVSPHVFTADLTGPRLRPATSNPTWNVHEWELR